MGFSKHLTDLLSSEDKKPDAETVVDTEIKETAILIDLSQKINDLKEDKKNSTRLNNILLFLLFVFALLSAYLFYSKSNIKIKYAMVDANQRIIPITMSDDPLIKPSDRIAFVERVARSMNSISFYNREDILTSYRDFFSENVFKDIIAALEADDLFNRRYMRKYSITSQATIIGPGRIIDDKVKGIRKNIFAEKIVVQVMQEIRKRGVLVQKLKFNVYFVIVRVPLNVSSFGYQIINYTVTPLS